MARSFAAFGLWLLLWVLWHSPRTAGFLKVEVAGSHQAVFLHENATILCKFSGSPHLDINITGITWFWKSDIRGKEVKLFELYGDHQKTLRSGAIVYPWGLEKGDASLQLLGVQLGDAGEYRCQVVVTPEEAQGSVRINVVARPVGRLFLEQPTEKKNGSKRFVCKSSGFYPEAINITWEKLTPKAPHYIKISEDVVTSPAIKNEDGTFNVTSYLNLQSSVEDNGTVYQCVIWHTSLPTLLRVNITQIVTGSEKTNALWILLAFWSLE
ncbi:natural cytotoxicity triggering receptor 3 ligand 1 [Otolemur garnettii]|uniref:natural cytotoxicity triggering receptor 3 ligand 1 n=1 Tax=Otolemur garnettii TaxID=30611 RepID=UPI000C7EF3E0|nr:natural cytotoxicity triggering receptor 3 ligand 1 [Otolemur garnettii]